MSPGQLRWWGLYVAALALVCGAQPIAVNLIPIPYSIESGFDRLTALLCTLLLPATLVAAAYWVRGVAPAGVKLVAAVAGLVALLLVSVVCHDTESKTLGANTCKFGWLSYGDVWVAIEPPPGASKKYTISIDWGTFSIKKKYELNTVRYLMLKKNDPFSDVPIGVRVAPDAYITCGAKPVPKDEVKTVLHGWKRR